MSTSKVLFERGSCVMSDSVQCGVDEDVWDDRKLNDAYDKALQIANAEVAKRVAMSTNTKMENREVSGSKTKKEKLAKSSSSKVSNKEEWKAGMACRALYEEDGLEYEAFVLRIIDDKECIVRFLGYENSEIVPISSLKVSLGKTERRRQIEQASLEKSDFPLNEEYLDDSDRVPSLGSTEVSFQRRKKSPKKKKVQKQPSFSEMHDLPFQMPNFTMTPNLAHLELPMPPPPPMAMPGAADAEEQAVSSMLLSWYMSGYYTGLYQGMKRARQGRGNV